MSNLNWIEFQKKLRLEKQLDFADIFIHKDLKVFMVKYHANQEVDKSKAEILVNEIYQIVEKGYSLGLNDARGPHLEISKEAREIYSNNKSLEKTIAQAVIVNELSTRILLNFFINLNKPVVPVKLFNSFDKALDWLLNFEE